MKGIILKELFGTRNAGDEVTFSNPYHILPQLFSTFVTRYSSSDLVESSIICTSHRLDNRTVVVCYFIAD